MPKVSVLLPTYNTDGEHLKLVIESILNQTFRDFEFLILDDGSTDPEVGKIVESYSDPRIVFRQNEKNLGISATRNRLIDLAQGEYLAVVDHDDISMPRRLQKQVEFLDRHEEIGVVGSDIERFPKTKIVTYPTGNTGIENLLMYDCVIEHPVAMIRKKVLLENGIQYEAEFSPSEDYALWCRLIGKTEFANIPEVLLKYRSHKGNTTHLQTEKMRSTSYRVMLNTRAAHPDIWERAKQNVPLEEKYKLFGLITLMTVKKRGKRACYYLLGFIPIMTSRWREEIFN